jgi:hypothetical protein
MKKIILLFSFFAFSDATLFAQTQGSLNLDNLIGNYSNNITKIMGGYRISSDSWLSISKKNSVYNYTLIITTIDEYNNNEPRKEITKGTLKNINNKIYFNGGDYGNRGANILFNTSSDLRYSIPRFTINFSTGRGNPIVFEKSSPLAKTAPVFKFKENNNNLESAHSNFAKHYDFKFFKEFYRKSSEYIDVNFEDSDYLTGVVKGIKPNKYYMEISGMENYRDDIQANLDILLTTGPGKGQTITVSTCLKNYTSNCNKCDILIEKLKAGTLLKFKISQVGNGEGRSFWFTDLSILN